MRPASCPMSPKEPEAGWISPSDQELLPCLLAIRGKGWSTQHLTDLAWAFGSVEYYTWSFQILPLPIAMPAPSHCPPFPCLTWPHFCLLLPLHSLYQEAWNRPCYDLSFCLNPSLTSLWPWRILSGFVWFVAWLWHMQFTQLLMWLSSSHVERNVLIFVYSQLGLKTSWYHWWCVVGWTDLCDKLLW